MNRLVSRASGVVVAVVVVLTACTADPPAAPSSSPSQMPSTVQSTSAPPATSVAEEAARDAIAAYLAMWETMAAAATTSDWQSPELSRHATGDALQVITQSLYTDHRNGVVTKGAPENDPTVSTLDPAADPTTVMILDCGDSTNWLKYRADDGQLADDEPGGRRAITAEVKNQTDGSWKVTRFAVEGLGSC